MLIIFDLDDTLIDTSLHITPKKLEEALRAMIRHGLVVGDFVAALESILAFYHSEENSLSALKVFLRANGYSDHFFSYAAEKMQEELSSSFEPSLAVPYAHDMLERVKNRYHLALVTIGIKDLQFSKLKKAGIDPSIFSKIDVIEGKNKKPSYQKIINDLGLASQKVIICGDRVSIDLEPAKELGCHTILLARGRGKKGRESALSSGIADYAIEDWSDFVAVIEHLEHTTLRHS